jgi:surfeit locus 1 family protein
MSFMPAKRLIGFTIVTLAALALLIGLGVWQLQRLEWKRGLIAEIETRTKAQPISLAERRSGKGRRRSELYPRVRVAGRFENDKERHLYAIADGARLASHHAARHRRRRYIVGRPWLRA